MGRKTSAIDNLIAERVRAYRKRLGITQSQLAAKLGVTFQQVQKYERGTNSIGAGRLLEIAYIFNIPIQVLYPESKNAVEQAKIHTKELTENSKFVTTVDGWRLFDAFLRVQNPQTRKKIIALVHQIAEK